MNIFSLLGAYWERDFWLNTWFNVLESIVLEKRTEPMQKVARPGKTDKRRKKGVNGGEKPEIDEISKTQIPA